MSEGYGPGIGSLVGLKLGSVQASAEQHASELNKMRDMLRNHVAGGLYDEAFAQAAAEVTAEIVGELDAVANGKPVVRRLSDPAAVAERNAAYVDRAAKIVRDKSDGKVVMTREDIARIKAQRPIK